MGLKGLRTRADASEVRRRSTLVERPQPQPLPQYQLTIASESQTWRVRRNVTTAGERAPAGRVHAVLGASARTLCGLDHAELARFPDVDFVTSPLERCEVCRSRGAALLH
jgi:hypothetical protein